MDNKTNCCIQRGNLSGGKWDKVYESCRRYYSVEGVSPTITTCGGGNQEVKIAEPIKRTHKEWKQECYKRFIEESNGGVNGVLTNQSRTFGYRPPLKGLSKCLKATEHDVGVVEGYRVRKLTPTECYRLMGLNDADAEKAKAVGASDSSLYKQAGNGIVTNCVELIFEHLYKAQYNSDYVCADEKN